MLVKMSLRDIRSSNAFVITAMCFALFTDTFIYGMVVPILPYLLLADGNMTKKAVQQWTSTLLASYGAALLIASPLVGYFCDRVRSRKLPLIFGFVAIALATILFMATHDPKLFLVARVCQGLSGAVVGVLGLTVIAETAPQESLGAYMAYGSLALTWGMLCGPITGGFLFAQFGKIGAFGTPIVLLVIDIVLRLLIIETRTCDKGKTPEISTKSTGPQEDSPLLRNEVPKQEMLSFYHYLHPIMLVVMFAVVSVSCVISAFESTLPLYVMNTYGWSSLGAGLVFLPMTLPSILSVPLGDRAGRFGPRNVVALGFILMVAPIIALRWTQKDTPAHEVLLCFLLLLIGMTMTTVQAVTMAEVSNAVRRIDARYGISGENSGQGQGYAFCNVAFAAGQFIGPVVGGLSSSKVGWGSMTLILGALCLVASIPPFFYFTSAAASQKEQPADDFDG